MKSKNYDMVQLTANILLDRLNLREQVITEKKNMKDEYILAVGLNPVMQKTLIFDYLQENEVNRCKNHLFTAAGKGANTARVLVQLGAKSMHLTHAGGLFQNRFITMLEEDSITSQVIDSKSEIRMCYTIINTDKHSVTELVEEAPSINPESDNLMREAYSEALGLANTVTISGSKAAGYKEDIIPWMVKEAVKQHKKIIIDIQGQDLLRSISFRPTIIKINLQEFIYAFLPKIHITKGDIETTLTVVQNKMRELKDHFGIITILTNGPHAVLTHIHDEIVEYPITPIKPVNTIGSGDAFTAGVAYGIYQSYPIAQCIEIGIACGTANARTLIPGSIGKISIKK
jgi:fructose-1-phosphate kinase PfkB-like protein